MTTKNAIRFANALLEFKKDTDLSFKQEYSSRGGLFLIKEKDEMTLSIGTYCNSLYSGNVYLTKVQAKKLAGYVYFWDGQYLIGEVTVKHHYKKKVLDINDVLLKKD